MTSAVQETTDRCDISKLSIGSVWTRHDSGKVTSIVGNTIYVKNDKGDEWNLTASLVASQFSFADQYDEELKVTRTEMISILKDNPQTAITVVYRKKPDEGIIADALADGQEDMTPAAWKSKVKQLIAGEERIMVGHHYGQMDVHDRLMFREHGKGHRLVDTRTLKSIIVNKARYTLK